ncbi:MAG: phosphoribulokinase [Methanomicrobiales archaeon]|nr:phosphoribulokinase [Methanomicrobiales archaeon]
MTEKHHPNFKDTIAASPSIFTIGVAGDSGSGKTTFTQGIRSIFGNDLVSTITLDDYHALDREGRKAEGVTALHPRANRIDRLEQDLIQLKRGVPIEKPVYNHATGTFDDPVIFRPQKILILEGLHTFSTPALRKYLDFTLFVNPERDVKYDWKIRRDVEKRGYSREAVLAEIRQREPDYAQYVSPQMQYADAVIGIGYSEYGKNLGAERNVYRVSLAQKKLKRVLEDIDLPLDLYSILSLSERNFALKFARGENDGRQMGELIIDGELSEHIARRLEQSIERQTRVHPISLFQKRDYVTAGDLVQLILCWRIIHRRIFLETSP